MSSFCGILGLHLICPQVSISTLYQGPTHHLLSTLSPKSPKKHPFSTAFQTTLSSATQTRRTRPLMPYKKPRMLVRPFLLFLLLISNATMTTDCGWIFAQHFCNRLGQAYLSLKNVLDEANPGHAEVLNQIKKRFREETFTRQGISEAISAYPELVSLRNFFFRGLLANLRHRSVCST